jgi:hypothetical protein
MPLQPHRATIVLPDFARSCLADRVSGQWINYSIGETKYYNPEYYFFFFSSAEQLRAKSGRISGVVGWKGIANFIEDVGRCDTSGQNIAARDSTRFAGQRPSAARSLSADKPFWLLLWLQKWQSLAANERREITIVP